MRPGFRLAAFASFQPTLPPLPEEPRLFGEATDGDDGRVILWGPAAGFMGDDILMSLGGDSTLIGDFVEFFVDPDAADVRFGDDLLLGGDGHDRLYGDVDELQLTGNGRNDVAVTYGADVLFSQAGNDEDGLQQVFGDSFVIRMDLTAAGNGNLTVLAGDDVVAHGGVYDASNSIFTAVGDSYWLVITLGAGTGTAEFAGGDDILFGGESVYGEGYKVDVSSQDNAGGRVVVTGGDDVLIAQEGTLSMHGDFYLYEGDGQFIGGNDTLVSGVGDNYLSGDFGQFGIGQAGADLFVFKDVFGDDIIHDFNPGLDRLVFDRDGPEGFRDLDTTSSGRGIVISFADDPEAGSIELIGVDRLHFVDVVFV